MSTEELDLQVGELVRGASMALRNAEALFREAAILYAQNALSRALFLHQISMEECGKIEILGAWATSLLSGSEVDYRRVAAALSSHKSKNFANAYFLPLTAAEQEARADADWGKCIQVFRDQQATFHAESNAAKNAALYVDFDESTFREPSERITDAMVREIASRNAEFIRLVTPKVEMMMGWQQNPEKARKITQHLRQRFEQLRQELPHDPEKALNLVLDEVLKLTQEGGQPGMGLASSGQYDA